MSISSANAQYFLSISSIFPAPQQLQAFATDDAFDTDPLDSAEVMMGVDGKLSAGFVYVAVKQTITLQADSPSNQVFDAWYAAQQVAQDVFEATGVIILAGPGTKWALVKGILTSYQPIPNVKKLIQPRRFGITWESVTPAPA